MVRRSLHRTAVDRLGRENTEYGWLLVVLLGLVLSRAVVGGVVDGLDALPPRLLDPHLLGTVVYATAGTVLLVALGALSLRVADPDVDSRPADTVRLPILTWGVLAVGAYVLLGATDVPPFPAGVVETFFGTVVPMGVIAVAYARRRGVTIRLSAQAAEAGPVVGPAVVGAAVAGVTPALLRRGLSPGPRLGVFAPDVPPLGTLLVTAVVVPSLVGAVYGLLFAGVVQEGLRDRFDPVRAVVVATALVGAYRLTAVPFPYGGPVLDGVVFVAGVAIPVLSAFLAVRAVAAVGPATTEPGSRTLAIALTVTAGVVLALVGVFWSLVLAWVFGLGAVEGIWGVLLTAPVYLVLAAIASVSYERVRSVWVPALVVAVFLSATTMGPYLVRAI